MPPPTVPAAALPSTYIARRRSTRNCRRLAVPKSIRCRRSTRCRRSPWLPEMTSWRPPRQARRRGAAVEDVLGRRPRACRRSPCRSRTGCRRSKRCCRWRSRRTRSPRCRRWRNVGRAREPPAYDILDAARERAAARRAEVELSAAARHNGAVCGPAGQDVLDAAARKCGCVRSGPAIDVFQRIDEVPPLAVPKSYSLPPLDTMLPLAVPPEKISWIPPPAIVVAAALA